ncbi:LacI family DNA-binding transcriptional regulator [Nocardia carnea]|uniref:LacI family DNA-binding transcriptional regulator n=1 Tax=Nocardia carnea TaxID=37328 RepID=UPI002456A7F5|nr:LacI family DNA-binding transcriptional regulator [Nocardia carnea]
MGRRVTLRDVAERSGVSPATVSFVLNEAPGQSISAATRDRVRQAATELGYVPHSLARALREGNSRLVLLEAGRFPWTRMLDEFIAGLDAELAAHDHRLLVSVTGANGSRHGLDASLQPRAVLDLPALYARPDREIADGGWIDGMAAHYATQIEYLHARGHRRIAVAAPATTNPFISLMTTHIHSAAAALDISVLATLELDTTGAAGTAPEIPASITAVAAISDEVALAALAALADRGRAVPDDIAVIGLGDAVAGRLWRPALTTVRVDTHTYGRRTAREILDLPAGDARPAPSTVVLRTSA